MTEQEFKQLAAQGYNRIPVVLETFADLDTPLSVYLKLANKPYSYLLESVQGGERFGRYSFIGLPAETRFEVRGHDAAPNTARGTLVSRAEHDGSARFRLRLPCPRQGGLPARTCRAFSAAWSAVSATTRFAISRKSCGRHAEADTLQTPDILLLLSEQLVVLDNLSGKLFLVVYADPREADAYARAQQRLQELLWMLRQPVVVPPEAPTAPVAPQSGIQRSAFIAAVERAKRYIFDGDIMQVVLSQRMSAAVLTPRPCRCTAHCARSIPRPTCSISTWADFHVVGASPEILVRLESGMRYRAADCRHAAARRQRASRTRAGAANCWPIRRSAPST